MPRDSAPASSPFVLGALLAALAAPCAAASFDVVNLVSDDPIHLPAKVDDPGLKNAWGVSFNPMGPFWVSSNGAGTATLYRIDPSTQATTKQALVVTIPGAGNVTGQVFNTGATAGAFDGDPFLFVSEDGTVSGWRNALGTTAEVRFTGSPANVYKGAAFATIGAHSYLYAANFRNGSVDVFKGDGSAPDLTGRFTDPNLTAGFAPFNVQTLNGDIYVAYAKQDPDKADEVPGAGLGFVDRFDVNGNLKGRLVSGGPLDAPWGLAIAPSSFGALAGSLLVGNFGNGQINMFDASTGESKGAVLGRDGKPLVIDGLWALSPGNGGGAGSTNLVYFSAGPDEENKGLLGVLTPVPEPSVYVSMLAGLAVMAFMRRRGRRDD